MYSLSDYDYTLPEKLIAQKPANRRENSRILRLDRTTGNFSDHRFFKLVDMLKSNDVLVVNNTKVIPARLFGHKETGGKVEILIINYATATQHTQTNKKIEFECLVKASKTPKVGTRMDFGPDLQGIVSFVHQRTCTIKFLSKKPFDEILDQLGVMPLPPYIKREQASDPKWHDRTNYQTVYAKNKGAVAAPTAGLHFSNEKVSQLRRLRFMWDTAHLCRCGLKIFEPTKCIQNNLIFQKKQPTPLTRPKKMAGALWPWAPHP